MRLVVIVLLCASSVSVLSKFVEANKHVEFAKSIHFLSGILKKLKRMPITIMLRKGLKERFIHKFAEKYF